MEFSVFSSITCAGVIFVLHLSSLLFSFLIAAMVVINYVLECFTNLGIACTYYSTHLLFEYKLMLVLLKLGV